jgi:hypothetical protein
VKIGKGQGVGFGRELTVEAHTLPLGKAFCRKPYLLLLTENPYLITAN